MERNRPAVGAQSIEALLDEENREVLAAMRTERSRSPRPKAGRGITPPPAIRSMLDLDSPPSRRGSAAGLPMGLSAFEDQRASLSNLNPADPSTWTRPHRASSPGPGTKPIPTSPTQQVVPTIQVDDEDTLEPKSSAGTSTTPGSPEATTKPAFRGHGKPESVSSPDVSSLHADGPSSPKARKSSNSKTRTERHIIKGSSPSRNTQGRRRTSNKSSSFSDHSDASELIGRVTVDDENALTESSDENDQQSSSDEGSPRAERGRGREKTGSQAETESSDQPTKEEEAPQSKGVRSLLEPVTNASQSRSKSAEGFGRSGPNLSDFDDSAEADIRRAKNLGLSISPVDDSIKERHVRMIIRGEWARLQEDSENSNHTSRLYLVCSDLSTEAYYALEWTVGTMLRDGDTLLAFYAIEDESAPKEPEGNREVMAESAKAAHDASQTMATLTRQTTNLSSTKNANCKFIPVTEASSLTGSVDARNIGKKQMERLRAMDEITQNFLKLVRKTPLQIRCMVEVIHCKSPKHLILNAIDELEPTLCVVGTRGRSSLKGVLLGSFSNYLVTKSSVPVMVARKRLKKPRHAKVSSTSIRLSNNLTNSLHPRQRRSLTQARID